MAGWYRAQAPAHRQAGAEALAPVPQGQAVLGLNVQIQCCRCDGVPSVVQLQHQRSSTHPDLPASASPCPSRWPGYRRRAARPDGPRPRHRLRPARDILQKRRDPVMQFAGGFAAAADGRLRASEPARQKASSPCARQNLRAASGLPSAPQFCSISRASRIGSARPSASAVWRARSSGLA